MPKDYSPLYESLEMRLDPDDVHTWNQLKTLMERLGYITEGHTPEGISTMVSVAWLKLKQGVEVSETRTPITKTRTTPQRIKRELLTTVIYKGERYEKGQEPPKDLPKVPFRYVDQPKRKGIVRQAIMGIEIDGKYYRKGQFIPRKLRVF